MKINLRMRDHRPVKVYTPLHSSTTPADLMRYVREVESELRGKQWARAKYAAHEQPARTTRKDHAQRSVE